MKVFFYPPFFSFIGMCVCVHYFTHCIIIIVVIIIIMAWKRKAKARKFFFFRFSEIIQTCRIFAPIRPFVFVAQFPLCALHKKGKRLCHEDVQLSTSGGTNFRLRFRTAAFITSWGVFDYVCLMAEEYSSKNPTGRDKNVPQLCAHLEPRKNFWLRLTAEELPVVGYLAGYYWRIFHLDARVWWMDECLKIV